jgi:tryptophan synthase alpha chain
MTNRINELFNRKRSGVLSVFYTAGFPKLNDTSSIALALENAGADIIEIGIPFSDPIADGPVIQQSNKQALDNGMNVGLLLSQVREIRMQATLPILLMGYLNPVLQYGMEKFCEDASQAGVDGLILPDMPMLEYQTHYLSLFERHNLLNTFLISPTTSEQRIRAMDSITHGFIYAVSSSSTTGARTGLSEQQLQYFQKLQHMNLVNPFLIGFGISSQESFKEVCKYSSGAIVGSSFINHLGNAGATQESIASFVQSIKG